MTVEKLKLNLIERVMKIDKSSTLQRVEGLIIQAEMEARAKESIDCFEKGEVHSLEEFRQMNQKWLTENAMK